MNFHDKIANLCLNHFKSLPKTGKPKNNEWTTLSCIVQENANKFHVVALGTGTKCIGNDKMSKTGDILNDSHAEIICRRAFLRYLYIKMFECDVGDDVIQINKKRNNFTIKPDVKFHFFTTHVPCGDAAIFHRQNVNDFGNLLNLAIKRQSDHPTTVRENKRRKTDDIFRTGAKCLSIDPNQDLKQDGEDYHKTGLVRTKPGRGIKSLSVSCSDKIAKWCYIGIQGALMTLLINEPIYLSTFTIAGGTHFCQEALNRALYTRLENVNLNHPFQRKCMIIGQSSFKFDFHKTETKSPCPSSIIWLDCANSKKIEVAVEGLRQGVTKKHKKNGNDRLKITKIELFHHFHRVISKHHVKIDDINGLCYGETKLLAKNYQLAWSTLKNEGFKYWTIKDETLLDFTS